MSRTHKRGRRDPLLVFEGDEAIKVNLVFLALRNGVLNEAVDRKSVFLPR